MMYSPGNCRNDVVSSEDQPPFGHRRWTAPPYCRRSIAMARNRRPPTAGYVEDLDVNLGTAAWITTGSPVPVGADAVVPVEATRTTSDGHVVIVDYAMKQETISVQ